MKTSAIAATAALLAALPSGCSSPSAALTPNPSRIAPVTTTPFGTTSDGRPATAYTLRNALGMTAVLTDFGATLVSFETPGRDGQMADVVLGFDDVSGYESEANQYFGCIAGRVANRLKDATFELDGETYELAANNAPHSLHGGDKGFGQRLWKAEVQGGASVTFRYVSPAGEEGYPGTLDVRVTYSLSDDGRLLLEYEATTDAPTLCNPTHHSYFNLGGHGSGKIYDHRLRIAANAITPTDDTLIPDGTLLEVEETPFDFRTLSRIGDEIDALIDTPALGYDHNYVLSGAASGGRAVAAELFDPASGRALEITTDQPGLQFYSGNFLFGQTGKDGRSYALRSACCLETQAFPAAPTHDHFPSIVLRPGETYRQTTSHHFTVR